MFMEGNFRMNSVDDIRLPYKIFAGHNLFNVMFINAVNVFQDQCIHMGCAELLSASIYICKEHINFNAALL